MLDTFLSGPYVPFTLSFGFLFGLLALELVFLMVGGSLFAADGEADFDLDADADFDVADLTDLGDAEFDMPDIGVDADIEALDLSELEAEGLTPGTLDGTEEPAPAAPRGLLAWLGLGKVPMMIWLAAFLFGFGSAGLIVQSVASGITGPLPAALAVVPAGIVAIWFARTFGSLFARLVPKTETQSVSTRSLGRRRGIVTQGTARRGSPAEVKVTDRYGNTHYLRAEPWRDQDTIPQGAEVLVARHHPTRSFRLVRLDG